MTDVLDIIKRRRSVRKFSPEQIKEYEIEAIIEAGLYAPSGGNGQPWHFLVIQDQNIIDHMSDSAKHLMAQAPVERVAKAGLAADYHVLHHAPTVIVVSGLKIAKSPIVLDGDYQSYTPLADCSAAIQNMLIAAESIGVASCWVGYIQYFFAQQAEVSKLAIPQEYHPIFAVSFGYRATAIGNLTAPKRKNGKVTYQTPFFYPLFR